MSSTPPTEDPAEESIPVTAAEEASPEELTETAAPEETPEPEPQPEPVQSTGIRAVIGVPKEADSNEKRVALVPDIVKKLVADGHTVLIESNAGKTSFFSNEAYEAVGAQIVNGKSAVFERADIVVKVSKPTDEEVAMLKRGQTLIAFFQPMVNLDLVKELQDRGVISFSMDAIPRISRAQYMDALSSMATVAGYKAVLMAADTLPKFMPLLSTAAGNIPPAKVLVIGAGVAGLQAIATARRLGAVVEAYDTRPAVKEQVQSLGARFVEINTGSSDTQTAAGYAREATPEELAAQQAELAKRSAKSDIIITTAAVPGRPAPRLISAETVEAMAAGSVIVDLASETGGNCELTEPGKVVNHNGVTIIGTLNLPSLVPIHASQMYAKNIQNLLAVLLDKSGALALNMEDEIVAGTIITRGGEVVHAGTRTRMGLG
jgi:H+-translocating NAD(P) transhydrogenase subunit alpha